MTQLEAKKLAASMTVQMQEAEGSEVQRHLGKTAAVPADEQKEGLSVDFEYVAPSEAYYYIVRALLG